MIRWTPFELHTHTVHSDAKHTFMEMFNKAKELGIEGIGLTDHNTISGWTECDSVTENSGICILKGMECTTFHGHMLILGLSGYEDWRQFTLENINDKIKDIRAQGGLVGLAHPFQIGSPISTGAYWEYKIDSWENINYIEVWNGMFSPSRDYNRRSFELWTRLLNEGYKITGVSGRDWHSSESEKPIAVTYLGIQGDKLTYSEKDALDAIAEGRAVVTLGPLLGLAVKLNSSDKKFNMGEEVFLDDGSDQIEVQLGLEFPNKEFEWKLEKQQLRIEITSNSGVLYKLDVPLESQKKTLTFSSKGLKWMRAELYGTVKDINVMMAFTNPVYFKLCI